MKNYQAEILTHQLITSDHLTRKAIVYVRQSTLESAGTRAFCESLVQLARAYGWPEHLLEVIDDDMGKSGLSMDHRSGYRRMLADIANNAVGIVFATSVSRLSREPMVYEQLRSLAAAHGTLFCVGNRTIDPSDRVGRDQQ